MNRNFGIATLILCFALTNVNLTWAAETVEVAPVVVQPYEIQELNQQMIDRDRKNRDEEIAIKQLVEDNDKLTQSTLARQQDEGLAKIDQTMLSYRDALVARDRARIIANGQQGWGNSRYGDLIALTEDADAMTVHQDLENRSGMLAEKYQMLTELKDEMTALNEKLKSKGQEALNHTETTIDGLKKTAQEQQDKIQTLVDKLGSMDQKIAHFDAIIAEKDHQISQLKETIRDLEDQIAVLQKQPKVLAPEIPLPGIPASETANKLEIPPIVVRTPVNQQESSESLAKDEIIKEKQAQVDLLKSELEDKITELKNVGPKGAGFNQQENQMTNLKAQEEELTSRDALIKSQADQIARATEQFKDQGTVYAKVRDQIMELNNKMQQQSLDLKAKDESIKWLNKVIAVTKDKAEYFKLTSQQGQLSMKQVQDQVQKIKDDFARRFKDYDQFETSIASLKTQVNQLGDQLSRKQQQVETLKAQLQSNLAEKDRKAQVDQQLVQKKQQQIDQMNSEVVTIVKQENQQSQQVSKIQQELKDKLQDKEDQIVKLKSDIQAILQSQANKEIYHRKAVAQVDDRIKLAKQLIDLQLQETALLEEKSSLYEQGNASFDKYFTELESKIEEFLAHRHIQTADIQNRFEELNTELSQKEQQVDVLNGELKSKISQEKNQSLLAEEIQDLKTHLQTQEDQISVMKKNIQETQKSNQEADSLKQQLAAEQDKADGLKQQLDSKTSQSDQLTMMLGEYQKKLESKDNTYNQELGQVLRSKNIMTTMGKQIAYLNGQVQQKEAEIIKIKKDMYDLQALTNTQDTKDLNLSMIQQKVMDDKINGFQDKINGLQVTNVRQLKEMTKLRDELSQARQQLGGTPSSDELEFLRTGLQQASAQLRQKNEMLSEIKANANEYAKEFKDQSSEFHNLKTQLLEAQQELKLKDEDLKYKDMAITRLKISSRAGKKGLKPQTVETMQEQLKADTLQIKNLQEQLIRLKSPNRKDLLEVKLEQALDKIDQQGRLINTLVKKLQDSGQYVNLTKVAGD